MRIRPKSARAGPVVADYERAGVSNYGINAVQVPSVSADFMLAGMTSRCQSW